MQGGHRARYVNRMKGHMLLNMLCKKPDGPSSFDTIIQKQAVGYKVRGGWENVLAG